MSCVCETPYPLGSSKDPDQGQGGLCHPVRGIMVHIHIFSNTMAFPYSISMSMVVTKGTVAIVTTLDRWPLHTGRPSLHS